MYRGGPPETADTEAEAPPRTHRYEPTLRRSLSGLAVMQLFGAPIAVGAAVAMAGAPGLALPAMVASGAGLYTLWRSRKSKNGVTLSIERGEVVIDWSSGRASERFSLDELDDVALDTKTIERVSDGASPIPAVRLMEGPVLEVDTARVVFVAGEREVPLTEDRVAYFESSDAAAKMRVFLRKNGWVPSEERIVVPRAKKRRRKNVT